jgi:hypothetical protein
VILDRANKSERALRQFQIHQLSDIMHTGAPSAPDHLLEHATPYRRAVPHATILSMMTDHILALLVAERDKLNRAIEALTGPTKRRGRPLKNAAIAVAPTATPAPAPAKRKGRTFSAAQRRAAAERMRLRWAAKKAIGKAAKKA